MQSEGLLGGCWVADFKLFSVKWGLFDGTHKSGINWEMNVSNLFNALSMLNTQIHWACPTVNGPE